MVLNSKDVNIYAIVVSQMVYLMIKFILMLK